jgi:hypothetical protein
MRCPGRAATVAIRAAVFADADHRDWLAAFQRREFGCDLRRAVPCSAEGVCIVGRRGKSRRLFVDRDIEPGRILSIDVITNRIDADGSRRDED